MATALITSIPYCQPRHALDGDLVADAGDVVVVEIDARLAGVLGRRVTRDDAAAGLTRIYFGFCAVMPIIIAGICF